MRIQDAGYGGGSARHDTIAILILLRHEAQGKVRDGLTEQYALTRLVALFRDIDKGEH